MNYIYNFTDFTNLILEGRQVTNTCASCGEKFTVPYNKRRQSTCSKSCAMKANWSKDEYRKNITEKSRETAYKKHNDPDVKFGWQVRPKNYLSKPEKIAKKFLNKNKIKATMEHRVGKYYIDVAVVDKKLAIEIDGLQHEHEERQLSDAKKDEFLKSKGWTVHRIKYPQEDIEAALSKILL
jgi:very-short-patch-repair endonuclease